MTSLLPVPYRRQAADHWCGPASVSMVLAFFGMRVSQASLARRMGTTKTHGTSRNRLSTALCADKIKSHAIPRSTLSRIAAALKRRKPVIVNYVEPHDDDGHYAVVTGLDARGITLNDPWHGKGFRIARSEFLRRWKMRGRWMLTASGRTR